MKNYSKHTLLNIALLISALFPAVTLAQDTTQTASAGVKKETVRATFENSVVLNNQTVEITPKKSLDFMIQHRFGLIESNDDLFGFYAPANIRMGLTYGITKCLAVGVGVTKNKMIYDLNLSASILKQTKQKGIPVSIAYFGNIGRSALKEENFYNQENEYKASNRLTYFNEIMIARKFNSHLSLQVAFTYSHMNLVDSIYQQHDFYGVSFVGKYKFSPQSSVLIDFDYLVNVSGIDESVRPKPNVTLGYEVSTGSHQFQVFAGTGANILGQEYRVYNTNDIADLEVLFGFNITRLWGF